MKQVYGPNIKLLYTDTDSLLYEIKTNDFYDDMKINLDKFDTSNFQLNNRYNIPLVNEKVLGLMKDENAGEIFEEFVGLRSKLYALVVQGKEVKKAKGVKKSVITRLKFKDYLNCLYTTKNLLEPMINFKSIKLYLYTQINNKITLSSKDDKRYLLKDSTDTLAWGHYKID